MSDNLYKVNSGRDIRVVVVSPYGELDLGRVTEFKDKPEFEKISSKPLTGGRIEMNTPDGWNLEISVDRHSPALDELAARMEADWFDNGVLRSSTVYAYVRELSGEQSTFMYPGVDLRLTDAGTWKRGNPVGQTLSGYAPRKKKI